MIKYYLVSGSGASADPRDIKRTAERALDTRHTRAHKVLRLNNDIADVEYRGFAITKDGQFILPERWSEFCCDRCVLDLLSLYKTLNPLPAEERWAAILQHIEAELISEIDYALRPYYDSNDKPFTKGEGVSLDHAVLLLKQKLTEIIIGPEEVEWDDFYLSWALALVIQLKRRTGPFCDYEVDPQENLSVSAFVVDTTSSRDLTIHSNDAVILVVDVEEADDEYDE